MTRNSKNHRRLNIERLELRELLCGSTVASSVLSSAAQSALFAKTHTTTTATTNTSKSTSGGDQSTETFLVTTLTNSSSEVVGTATFETEVDGSTTKQTLIISVVGAAASATYTVSAGNDTDLGTLTTDANGNGRLVLTSSSSTSGTTSSATASSNCSGGNTITTGTLPADFAQAAGATISLASIDTSVDPLSGTFATSTGPIGEGRGFGGDHGGCHGNGNSSSVSRTTAALSDSATSDSVGKAVFTTITHTDGTTAEILRVHVTGTDVSSIFDVSVDGTPVGSITTDANGNGSLILSSNPKTSNVGQLPSGITSPTNITISNATTGTTITGTFSSSSSSSATGSFASASRFFSHRR